MLPDTKTGRSMRPLSHAACDVLHDMPRIGGGALVFPASRGDGLMSGFKRFGRRIFALASLPADVTPHGIPSRASPPTSAIRNPRSPH